MLVISHGRRCMKLDRIDIESVTIWCRPSREEEWGGRHKERQIQSMHAHDRAYVRACACAHLRSEFLACALQDLRIGNGR